MNESTLTQLKVLVERAVRPVRASTPSKRRMREELLAHLTAAYEEEAATPVGEQAAVERARRRFGDPAELTARLQQSVPASDRIALFLEGLLSLRAGERPLRRAARLTALFSLCSSLLYSVAVLPIQWAQGWLAGWPATALLLLTGSALVFAFTLLSHWTRKALYGRWWLQAALSGLLTFLLVLGSSFGLLLAVSQDVASGMAAFRAIFLRSALPLAVLAPVFVFIVARETAKEVREAEEWARLQME